MFNINKKVTGYSRDDIRKALIRLLKIQGKKRINLVRMRYIYLTKRRSEDKFNHLNDIFLENLYGKNVIDIGCHIGFFGIMIAGFANKVIGIDMSEKLIEKAVVFANLAGAYNIRFKVKDLNELDEKFLTSNNIHAAFAHKISSHIDDNQLSNLSNTLFKCCDIIIVDSGLGERIKLYLESSEFNFSFREVSSFKKNSFIIFNKVN